MKLQDGEHRGLPALPPKKWFGNFSPRFLEERREQLENYLHQLAANQEVEVDADFTSFLGADQGGASGMTAFDWNYRTGGSRFGDGFSSSPSPDPQSGKRKKRKSGLRQKPIAEEPASL
eukprot:g1888.t1